MDATMFVFVIFILPFLLALGVAFLLVRFAAPVILNRFLKNQNLPLWLLAYLLLSVEALAYFLVYEGAGVLALPMSVLSPLTVPLVVFTVIDFGFWHALVVVTFLSAVLLLLSWHLKVQKRYGCWLLQVL